MLEEVEHVVNHRIRIHKITTPYPHQPRLPQIVLILGEKRNQSRVQRLNGLEPMCCIGLAVRRCEFEIVMVEHVDFDKREEKTRRRRRFQLGLSHEC